MPLQSSGSITFANIQTEFGGTNPIGINEYYLNGTSGYVAGSGAVGIPTSGQISINQFYGKAKVVADTVPAAVATNFYNATYYHPQSMYLGSVGQTFITGFSGNNLSRTGVSTVNLNGYFSVFNKPSNLMIFSSYVLQARAGDTIQINVGWASGPYRSPAYIYLYLNFGNGYIFANSYTTPYNFAFYTIYGSATFNYPIASNISPGNYAISVLMYGDYGYNAYYFSLHLY